MHSNLTHSMLGYLGNLGLILLLTFLYWGKVMSGTIKIHQLPFTFSDACLWRQIVAKKFRLRFIKWSVNHSNWLLRQRRSKKEQIITCLCLYIMKAYPWFPLISISRFLWWESVFQIVAKIILTVTTGDLWSSWLCLITLQLGTWIFGQ